MATPKDPPRQQLPRYNYKALEKSDVTRIVSITPGHKSAPLEISIIPTGLALRYEALSWYWGTSAPTVSIFVKESGRRTAICVKPTIEKALLALRRTHEARFVWIDALCINQDDSVERAVQVADMLRIYKSAQRVLVWFDFETPSNALEIINNIRTMQDMKNLMHQDQCSSSQRGGLTELLLYPWFGRRWIIQEVAAARRLTIITNGCEAEWEDLCRVIHLLHEYHDNVENIGPTPDLDTGVMAAKWAFYESKAHRLIRLISSLEEPKTSSPARRLEHLLTVCVDFQCQRGQDIIFALLPLVPDCASPPSQLATSSRATPPRIMIDYQMSTLRVYKDFIKMAIHESGGRLDVILRYWATRDPDIPYVSWIRTERPVTEDWESRQITQRELVGTVEAPIFAASGCASSMQTPLFVGKAGLRVSVIVVDKIGSMVGANPEVISRAWPIFSGWSDTTQEPPEMFWHTLVAGLGADGQRASGKYRRLCHQAFSTGDFRLFSSCSDVVYLELKRVFGREGCFGLTLPQRWDRLNFGVRHPDQQLRIVMALEAMSKAGILKVPFLRYTSPLSSEAKKFIHEWLSGIDMEALVEQARYRRLVHSTVLGRVLFKSSDAAMLGLAPKKAQPGDL